MNSDLVQVGFEVSATQNLLMPESSDISARGSSQKNCNEG